MKKCNQILKNLLKNLSKLLVLGSCLFILFNAWLISIYGLLVYEVGVKDTCEQHILKIFWVLVAAVGLPATLLC